MRFASAAPGPASSRRLSTWITVLKTSLSESDEKEQGWIAGAGLDDIEEEPAKHRDWTPVNPLFGLNNVIITPHAAYYSEEAIHTVRDFAASEVVRVLTGQPPLSAVDEVQVASTRRAAGSRLIVCAGSLSLASGPNRHPDP